MRIIPTTEQTKKWQFATIYGFSVLDYLENVEWDWKEGTVYADGYSYSILDEIWYIWNMNAEDTEDRQFWQNPQFEDRVREVKSCP